MDILDEIGSGKFLKQAALATAGGVGAPVGGSFVVNKLVPQSWRSSKLVKYGAQALTGVGLAFVAGKVLKGKAARNAVLLGTAASLGGQLVEALMLRATMRSANAAIDAASAGGTSGVGDTIRAVPAQSESRQRNGTGDAIRRLPVGVSGVGAYPMRRGFDFMKPAGRRM